ncbi:MAG: CotH kinase family protein [Bacteroidaceae bacterium]|nr:CotH kinase family protein [Bacteroidaceae bacterium]
MKTDKRRFCMLLLATLMAQALPLAGQTHRLLINEVEVANIDAFIDPSYNYGGWIEVYNPDESGLSLMGITVRHTDSEGKISTHLLNSAHGMVAAGGMVCLWFDHNSSDGYYGNGASTQIRYKLDADGGLIELVARDGTLIDAVNYPPALSRCSWARTADGGEVWAYTSNPTPAKTNATSKFAQKRLDAPVVSVDGGLMRGTVNFSVTIPAGAKLLYTTDGSTPVEGESMVSASGNFSVNTTTIYRFMCVADGYLNSPVVTRSFIMQDKDYYLPIVSICSHPDNFFSNQIGLYVRGTNGRVWNNSKTPANQNMDWERPVNVEYMVPNVETNVYRTLLNQGANFSIFGGWTRFNAGDEYWEHKSSFKLKADRLADGENFFTAAVFDSKPYIKLKHLLVRNGGQDQYERFWDAALQELLRTSGLYLDCQAYQPAHIFINGRYLGMLNLREASNSKYAYSNYGIGGDEIDEWEDEFTIKEGDAQAFNRWYTLCQQLAKATDKDSIWTEIACMLDVDEYCNYMAAEIYMGNLDWVRTGMKNIKGFRARTDDGKIHVVAFDLDGCFGDTNMIATYMSKNSKLCTIFKDMMTYQPFRKQFIDAYCLIGGSVFLPDRCLPIINKITENIAPALLMEGLSSTTRIERLRSTLSDRDGHYKAAMNSLQSTLSISNPYNLNIKANTGQARLKLNSQEIPTGRFDGRAYKPIVLTASAPAGYEFRGWEVDGVVVETDSVYKLSSKLGVGTYSIIACFDSITDESERLKAGIRPVVINEVSSANDIYINEYMKKADWIELYNTTGNPIDLAGMYLTDTPDKPMKYQIPADGNSVIPPFGYKVVWCDGREPISQLHASFKLANADSAYVAITAADESWHDAMTYKAQGRWQSYGRYPDGGNGVAMFDRITIGQSNHVNTQTEVAQYAARNEVPDAIIGVEIDRVGERGTSVASVKYYNVNGQQISQPSEYRIVIQKTTYTNGYIETRKVVQAH